MNNICRICGEVGHGVPFADWVRPTFTDHDKLQIGDIICHRCRWLFEERSELLAQRVGKDKPQRMRNYSHFVVDGRWIPLSKGNKPHMKDLLLGKPFPELACIADSGQKHIFFRAKWNPSGSEAGYVQFEEQSIFIERSALAWLLERIEKLYVTFNKAEIGTGDYSQYRILKFGLGTWRAYEHSIAYMRDSVLFKLALFLAQKGEGDGGVTRQSSGITTDNLAGSAAGLQAQVHEHLGAIREQYPVSSPHQQSGQVRQLAMFEDERQHGQKQGRASTGGTIAE